MDASGWINAYTTPNVRLYYSDAGNPTFPETLVYFDNMEVRPQDNTGNLLSNIVVAADYEDYPLGNGPPQDPDGWHPHTAYFFGATATSNADFLNDSVVRAEDREFTQFGGPVTSRVTAIGSEASSLTFIPQGEPSGGFTGIATFPSAPTTAENPAYNFKESDTPVLDIQIDFAFFPDSESEAWQQWEFFLYDPGTDLENPGFFPHSGVVVNRFGGVSIRDDHFDFQNQVDIESLTLNEGELYRLIMRIDYERSTWSAWIQDFDGGITQIANDRSHTASGLTSTGVLTVQNGMVIDSEGNGAAGEVIFDNVIVRAVPSSKDDGIKSFSIDFEDFTAGENSIFRHSPGLRPFDGWKTNGTQASRFNEGTASIVADNPINGTLGGLLGGIDPGPDDSGQSIGIYSGYQRAPYNDIITNGPLTKSISMDVYLNPVDGGNAEFVFYKFASNNSDPLNATVVSHSIIYVDQTGNISVSDSFSSEIVATGLTLDIRTPYRLTMDLDYGALTWSASFENLDTNAVITPALNRSFTTGGWVATRDAISMFIRDDFRAAITFDNIDVDYGIDERSASNLLASVDFETFTIGSGVPSGGPEDVTIEMGPFGSADDNTFPDTISQIVADPATGNRALHFGDMTGSTFSPFEFYGIGAFTPEKALEIVDIANSPTPVVTRSVVFTWSPQEGGSEGQVFWFSVTDPLGLSDPESFRLHSAIEIGSDGSISYYDVLDGSDATSAVPLNVTLTADTEYTLFIRNDYSTMRWDAFLANYDEGQINLVEQRKFSASGLINPDSIFSIDTAFFSLDDGLVGNDVLIIDYIESWAASWPTRSDVDINLTYDFEGFTNGLNGSIRSGGEEAFSVYAYGSTTSPWNANYTGIAEGTSLDPDGKVGYIGGTDGTFANIEDSGGFGIFSGMVDSPEFHVFDLNTPVITHSIDFRIEPSATRLDTESVSFYIYDPADRNDIQSGNSLAVIEFLDDGSINYESGQSEFSDFLPTNHTYANHTNYRLNLSVDYLRNRWSATIENLETLSAPITLVEDEVWFGSGWIDAPGSLNIELSYSDFEASTFPETVVYIDNYTIQAAADSGELLSNIIVSTDYSDYPLGNGPPQDPDGWHPHSAFFFGAQLKEDALFYQDSVVRVEDREYTVEGETVSARALVIGGESTTLKFSPNEFAGIGVFPSAPENGSFDFKNSDTPVLDVQIDFAFFPDESEIYQQWEFFMYDPGSDIENPGFFPHSYVNVNRWGGIGVYDQFLGTPEMIDDLTLNSGELYRLIMRVDYQRQQWSAWIQDFDGAITQIADRRSMNASGINSITSGMDIQAGFSIDADGNIPTGEIIVESWDVRAVPQDTTPVAESKLVDFEDFTEGPDNLFRRSPALQPFDGFRSIGAGASVVTSGIASVVTNNPINGTQGGRLGGVEDSPDGNFKFFGVFGNYQNSPYVNLLDNGITEKQIEVDFYFDPVEGGSTGVTFYKFGANASSAFENAPANFNAIVSFGVSGAVFVADDFNSGFADTGVVLALRTPYKITFDYNYGAQTWSASIKNLLTDSEDVLATNRSFPASGWIGAGDLLTIQISNDYRGELFFDNIGVSYSDGLGDPISFGDLTGGETWSDVTAFSSELGMGGISRNANSETEPAIRLDEEEPFITIAGVSFDSPDVEVADFVRIDGADRPLINTFDSDGNAKAYYVDASDVLQEIPAPTEIGRSPTEVTIVGGFDEFGADGAMLIGNAVTNLEGDLAAFTWTAADGATLIPLPRRYSSTKATAVSTTTNWIAGYGELESGAQEIWLYNTDTEALSFIDNLAGARAQVYPTVIEMNDGFLVVWGHHKETPNRFRQPFVWTASEGVTIFDAPETFDEFITTAWVDTDLLVGYARAHAPVVDGSEYNANASTDAQWRPFLFQGNGEYVPFRAAAELASKLPEGWTPSTVDYADGTFFGRAINPTGHIEGYAIPLSSATLKSTFDRVYTPILESVASYAQSEPAASGAIIQSVFSGVTDYMTAQWTRDGVELVEDTSTVGANGTAGTYQVRFSDNRDVLAQSETVGEVVHSISELSIVDPNLLAAATDAVGLTSGQTPSRRELSSVIELEAESRSISDLTGINEMPNIMSLDLNDNDISDTTPLAGLAYLSDLDISDNPLGGANSQAVVAKSRTKNNTPDDPLDFVSQTPNLEGLNLSNTGIDSVEELSNVPSLKALELADNPIVDVSVIEDLPQIAEIDISGTDVDDISFLSMVPTIEEVNLSNTDITDLTPLSNAPLLKELDISDTMISDLSALANAPSLRELDLANTNVTNLSLLGAAADNLEEVELGGTPITNILALAGADLQFLKMPGVDTASANLDAISQKLAQGSLFLIDPTDPGYNSDIFGAYSNVVELAIKIPLQTSYRLEQTSDLGDREAGDVPTVNVESDTVFLLIDPSAHSGKAQFFQMFEE